jgi:glycopeptide antibiotics resistance protein
METILSTVLSKKFMPFGIFLYETQIRLFWQKNQNVESEF